MPDGGGLFRRLWERLTGPPSRPEIPREPPGPPDIPIGGPGTENLPETPFRDIWDEQVNTAPLRNAMERTGYSENELFQLHTEILVALDPEEDRDIQLEMWDDYIAAFINGEIRFDDFFDRWGIDPADFSWALWREAMGY